MSSLPPTESFRFSSFCARSMAASFCCCLRLLDADDFARLVFAFVAWSGATWGFVAAREGSGAAAEGAVSLTSGRGSSRRSWPAGGREGQRACEVSGEGVTHVQTWIRVPWQEVKGKQRANASLELINQPRPICRLLLPGLPPDSYEHSVLIDFERAVQPPLAWVTCVLPFPRLISHRSHSALPRALEPYEGLRLRSRASETLD